MGFCPFFFHRRFKIGKSLFQTDVVFQEFEFLAKLGKSCTCKDLCEPLLSNQKYQPYRKSDFIPFETKFDYVCYCGLIQEKFGNFAIRSYSQGISTSLSAIQYNKKRCRIRNNITKCPLNIKIKYFFYKMASLEFLGIVFKSVKHYLGTSRNMVSYLNDQNLSH